MSDIELKDLNYYMSLNYTIVINKIDEKEGSPYYYGRISELDGCHTTADTIEELVPELEGVKKDYLEIKLEHGDPIPEPGDITSGNITLRIPKTLHWRLSKEAKQKGVPLSDYMIYILSQSL